MNQKQFCFRSIIESHEGISLDGPDERMFAMDRLARSVIFLPPESSDPDEENLIRRQLDDFLTQAVQRDNEISVHFVVYTSLEELYRSPEIRNGLPKLFAGLLPIGFVDLIIDFSRPPQDWLLVAKWLYRLVWEHRKLHSRVQLRGPYPLLSEEVKDAFHSLGIHLEYTAGWRPGTRGDAWEVADPDALHDLARYGFRIPIRYYAHAANLSHAATVVEDGLRLNEYSGFAIPAIFHHPEYDPASSPAPPSATAYADLLARLYHDLPQYDDIFQPVAELASLMGEGGWSTKDDVPASLRLLLRPEQGVLVFRQVPGKAIRWAHWSELSTWSADDITPRLFRFHRQRFAWAKHAFCGQCPWRYVCGGSDAVSTDPRNADEAERRAVCEYRLLFLEAFARKKAELLSLGLSISNSGNFASGLQRAP